MKRLLSVLLVASFVCGLTISGCASQKEGSAQEAIDASRALDTTTEKINYLIKQAQAFYNSKEFQDTIDIAQYVLRYLDRDSQEAKNLLEKAREALTAAAEAASSEVKKKLDVLGQ